MPRLMVVRTSPRLAVLPCLVAFLVLGGCASSASTAGHAARAQSTSNSTASVDDVRAQQLLIRGMTRAYMGDYQAALDLYTDALRFAPNEPAILSALSEVQQALGDLTAALFFATQAKQYGADNRYYHHQLAALQVEAGDLPEAAATYEALLQRFPGDIEALGELADLYVRTGRLTEAVSAYDTLLARTGEDVTLYRRRLQLFLKLDDQEGVEATLKHLIDLMPDSAEPRRMLGELYVRQERLEDARRIFEQMLAEDPSNEQAALALEDLYLKQGLPARADSLRARTRSLESLETASVDQLVAQATTLAERAATQPEADSTATLLLRRALELDPEHTQALVLLGTLYYHRGAFGQAATALSRALDQNPRDVHVWTMAATATLQAGDAAGAVRLSEEGLLLFPGQIALMRVAALSLMESGAPEAALLHLEKALALAQEDQPEERSDVLAALGMVYAHTHNFAASDSLYEQALAQHDDNATALNSYALSLATRLYRLEKAAALAERAVALEPRNPAFLDTLGWVYHQMGAFDKAALWIEKAIATKHASATAYEHLGDVRMRLGQLDAARDAWQQALKLNPNNQTLQTKLERQQP